MKADDYFFYSAIEKQASKIVYKTFGINRHELNMLVGLSAYLLIIQRKIVSRDTFTGWLGVNYGLEKRCYAYLRGLIDKGCLHRLSYRRPDGHCLAFSEYGVRVIECFENAIAQMERQEKRVPGSYRNLPLDQNALPQGYVLRQVGRSS